MTSQNLLVMSDSDDRILFFGKHLNPSWMVIRYGFNLPMGIHFDEIYLMGNQMYEDYYPGWKDALRSRFKNKESEFMYV